MGLDGMRFGGGRCPPLFVGGLLVACFLLVCNWWSLSTENLELLRQLEELNEQLKISAEERDQCVTLRENVEQRYKRLKDEVGTLHVRLQQQNELKKQNGEISESLTMCKSELDSLNKLDATKSATLETLRLEKDTMSTQLDAKREENQRIKAKLESALNELEKLKLSGNVQKNKVPDDAPLEPTRGTLGKGQLSEVDESAVEISVSGQQGMKYHGIPILPSDPPGVIRQSPRFPVTMPKGKGQLGQVDESAVEISVSGQQGMKYHGIPILPSDPPGVRRESPRFSVTMPKVPTPDPMLQDNSANEVNGKEIQDDPNADPSINMSGGGDEINRFIQPDEPFDLKNEAVIQQP